MATKVSPERNARIHEEVVLGLVKIELFVAAQNENRRYSFDDFLKVGCRGVSKLAEECIVEFIKDCGISIKPEVIEPIRRGNYSWVWEVSNQLLVGYGYPPVKPVPSKLTQS